MLCNVSVGRELCKAAVRALPLLCRHKVCHHLIWDMNGQVTHCNIANITSEDLHIHAAST